jgi:hypothetical protein
MYAAWCGPRTEPELEPGTLLARLGCDGAAAFYSAALFIYNGRRALDRYTTSMVAKM